MGQQKKKSELNSSEHLLLFPNIWTLLHFQKIY
jgi:hypothetical protein